MNSVGEGLDDAMQEVRTIHLTHVVPELDMGELGNTANGQEHIEHALSQAQRGNVDMHVTWSWSCPVSIDTLSLVIEAQRLWGLGF